MIIRPKALLALEDGKVFTGCSCGAPGERWGEVVFNTSMTGYQEILTDPSYKGQIVTMTYPLIGNYGVNEEDFESLHPWVEGFAVKEICSFPSSWRSQKSLEDFLKQNGIVAIEGLDTRALTKHLRSAGAMRGILSTLDLDSGSLVRKARSSPSMVGADWVQSVTCAQPDRWSMTTTDSKLCCRPGSRHWASRSSSRPTEGSSGPPGGSGDDVVICDLLMVHMSGDGAIPWVRGAVA